MKLDSNMKSNEATGKLIPQNLLENNILRSECSYQNHSQRFAYQAKDFSKQFFHIYGARLTKMREILSKSIESKWGNKYPIYKLQELKEDEPVKCIVIGTLFKHQELKPSILKEISEEQQLLPQPPRTFFVEDSDTLIMEDELQRIRLIGNVDVHSVVTGVVCAVLGEERGGDKFFVEDVCWAGLQNVVDRPMPAAEDNLIILVSGLDLANSGDSLLPLQLFSDWVGGWLGDAGEQGRAARAVRMVVAGNALRAAPAHKATHFHSTFAVEDKDAVGAVRLMDDTLLQLARSIDVDLMPGEFDPANHMLPQQPLHFCLMPQASSYETMHGVTNPYEFEIGGRRVIGSSGQPVDDVKRFSKLDDSLEILESTLRWGHLAPTCPDTIPSYPYYHDDPFVIQDAPDIYFVGNQPQFQTKIYVGEGGHRVRLVSVPAFCKTHSCVVVNLTSLDCYPVSFDVSPDSLPDK